MAAPELDHKYDSAAPVWADKMRLLGYNDAYLGFLASETFRAPPACRVLDIGCGTGAFADAWAAIHGPDQDITLLDPSQEMLRRAHATLAARGMTSKAAKTTLEEFAPDHAFDSLLAAHVIEHQSDPIAPLSQMRRLIRPDGRLWLIVSKPHWCNAIIWLQWRHRAYRPDDVAAFLAKTGWKLEAEYAFPSGPPSRTSRGYLARAV